MLIKSNIRLSQIKSDEHGIICYNENDANILCKSMDKLGYVV